MILNVNVGGTKGWKNIPESIRKDWTIFDSSRGAEIKHDLNSGDPFPIATSVVDNYYTSHTLEHIDTFSVLNVMREFHRTLKPGGKIRIVVPNIHFGIQLYLAGDLRLYDKIYCTPDPALPKTALGRLMGWWQGRDRGKSKYYSGHRTAFDFETLSWYLKHAGFKSIKNLSYNRCSKIFKGLDNVRYAHWSLFMEATI